MESVPLCVEKIERFCVINRIGKFIDEYNER